MTRYDVFNGDADGVCSLHQLRLAEPCESVLVSGPKRDIALVDRVDAVSGDIVTVLDVSMAVNREGVVRLLHSGPLTPAALARGLTLILPVHPDSGEEP